MIIGSKVSRYCPESVYVEMALAAAAEGFASQSFVLKDFEFRRALFLPDGETHTIQVILSPDTNARASIHIYSRTGDVEQQNRSWTLHATGKLCPQDGRCIISRSVEREVPAEIRARCSEPVSAQDYYLRLRESGIDYGPSLRSITQLWRSRR